MQPVIETADIIEFLQSVRLFRRLKPEALGELARQFEVISLNDGEILFYQDTPGGDFYLIISGKIHLAQDRGERHLEIGTLSRYDFFGEESYLRSKYHTATATSLGEAVVLALPREHFGELLNHHPDIREDLKILARSYHIARRKEFEWLEDDEVIHIISQKHFYVLLSALLPGIPIAL